MLKRPTIALAIIFVMILGINYLILKNVEHMPSENTWSGKAYRGSSNNTAASTKLGWKETDPKELEKYGITVTPAAVEPTTPDGWQMYLQTNFDKFKVLETAEAKEAIQSMRTTPEQYQKTMKKLAEDAAVVQQRLNEDPFNTKHQEQLQNIYKLQAIAKILEQKGVVQDDYLSAVTSAAPAPADPIVESIAPSEPVAAPTP